MARVAVVGAGVGGLAAAIRLRAAGHTVDVFERRDRPGGKLDSRSLGGAHFDTGPSLLTLPHVFDELLGLAGTTLEASVKLSRLDPAVRYRFADGSGFDAGDDLDSTAESIAAMLGNAGAEEWRRFMRRSERTWKIAERTFFTGAMENPWQLVQRMRSPLDLVHIDGATTLARRAARSFTDARLQMWLNRYATYSGSSPWQAPATLACIPHIEQAYGSWHIEGGLTTLAGVLGAAAESMGVQTHFGSAVERITTAGDNVDAIHVDGARVEVDAVVANVDAEAVYSRLLPDPGRLRRVRSAGRSSSGFAILLVVDGQTSGLAHHNIWFTADQRQEFRQIFEGAGVANDPTIYVCCSSVTDSTAAPAGKENWFVLVNVAAGARTDWKSYGDRIIERLGVGAQVSAREDITPDDIAMRYGAPGGAIYGSSSNGRRSAFLRAANRGPVKGLYLAGGSAHPGGGLPLVAMSGAIAADLAKRDLS